MGDFKEWLSDNLRYFLVGVVVILIIGGSILGLKIYSSKVNGNSDPAVIRKNTEAQTETGKETETKKQTEKETKKQTEKETKKQTKKKPKNRRKKRQKSRPKVQHLPMQVQTVKEVQQITAKMAAIPQTMLHRTVAAHTVMAHRAATVHMIMQAMMQRPMAVTTAMTRRM